MIYSNKKSQIIKVILVMILITTIMVPIVSAQTGYHLLEPLPALDGTNSMMTGANFDNYIQYIFNLVVALAAVAAVFMITYGGFKYMTTDSFQGKDEGKKILTNAVLGLLLVLSSYLILRTIDPRLVEIRRDLVKQLEIKCPTNPKITIDSPDCRSGQSDFIGSLISELERQEIRDDNKEAIKTLKEINEEKKVLEDELHNIKAELERAQRINTDPELILRLENDAYNLQRKINDLDGRATLISSMQTQKNNVITVDSSVQTLRQVQDKISVLKDSYEKDKEKLISLGQQDKIEDLTNLHLLSLAKMEMEGRLATVQRGGDPNFWRDTKTDMAYVFQGATFNLIEFGKLASYSDKVKYEELKSISRREVQEIYKYYSTKITDPDLVNELFNHQKYADSMLR